MTGTILTDPQTGVKSRVVGHYVHSDIILNYVVDPVNGGGECKFNWVEVSSYVDPQTTKDTGMVANKAFDVLGNPKAGVTIAWQRYLANQHPCNNHYPVLGIEDQPYITSAEPKSGKRTLVINTVLESSNPLCNCKNRSLGRLMFQDLTYGQDPAELKVEKYDVKGLGQ